MGAGTLFAVLLSTVRSSPPALRSWPSGLPVLSKRPVMTSFGVLVCVALFGAVQVVLAPDAPFVAPLATSTPVPDQNGSQAAGTDNVSKIALCQ